MPFNDTTEGADWHFKHNIAEHNIYSNINNVLMIIWTGMLWKCAYEALFCH